MRPSRRGATICPACWSSSLPGYARLAGIDAAADGPLLVVQSMRQSHRLAISWDMVFDPATLMFLVGGLAWITIDAGRLNSIRLRWAEWGWTLARFALDRGRLAADPRDRAPGPLSSSRRGQRVEPAAARDEPVPLALGAADHARSPDPAGLAMGALAGRCSAAGSGGKSKKQGGRPGKTPRFHHISPHPLPLSRR